MLLQIEGPSIRHVLNLAEHFDRQSDSYIEETLRPDTVRIAIEAGTSYGWAKYIGTDGGFIGLDSFGASAPAGDLYKHFGITAEAIAEAAKQKL